MEQDKEITMGPEARQKIKAGIDRAANAVKPTLGVVGMSAVIEVPGLDPIECDDGVTILRHLKFKDPYEQIGLQKLRKAAIRTSEKGGDGTATTTVLTQALVAAAFREVAGDSSRIREVRERLGKGLEEVLGLIQSTKRDVKEEDIERIATISSLDKDIAKIIAEIVKEVGADGEVTVEKGNELGYTKEVVSGAKFERGSISHYFLDPKEEETVLESPFIALIDRRVSLGAQVKNIMDEVSKTGNKSILFIADEVDGQALASLVQSSKNVQIFDPNSKTVKTGTYNVIAVRNPYTATPAKDFLEDMAALTGATVMSEEAGMRLDDCGMLQLGNAEKVTVSKEMTKIIGGKGNPDALKARIELIAKEMAATTSEYQRAILKERLARLSGGFGVVRVGAYTDTDYNSKKYKFDNAIAATLAAMQEGIVPGGGVAMAYASSEVKDKMFVKALMVPFNQMCTNAGMEDYSGIVFTDLLGIDFATKTTSVNMFDAGIIDPFKVIRLALESAVAITMSLISYETAIVAEKSDDAKAA